MPSYVGASPEEQQLFLEECSNCFNKKQPFILICDDSTWDTLIKDPKYHSCEGCIVRYSVDQMIKDILANLTEYAGVQISAFYSMLNQWQQADPNHFFEGYIEPSRGESTQSDRIYCLRQWIKEQDANIRTSLDNFFGLSPDSRSYNPSQTWSLLKKHNILDSFNDISQLLGICCKENPQLSQELVTSYKEALSKAYQERVDKYKQNTKKFMEKISKDTQFLESLMRHFNLGSIRGLARHLTSRQEQENDPYQFYEKYMNKCINLMSDLLDYRKQNPAVVSDIMRVFAAPVISKKCKNPFVVYTDIDTLAHTHPTLQVNKNAPLFRCNMHSYDCNINSGGLSNDLLYFNIKDSNHDLLSCFLSKFFQHLQSLERSVIQEWADYYKIILSDESFDDKIKNPRLNDLEKNIALYDGKVLKGVTGIRTAINAMEAAMKRRMEILDTYRTYSNFFAGSWQTTEVYNFYISQCSEIWNTQPDIPGPLWSFLALLNGSHHTKFYEDYRPKFLEGLKILHQCILKYCENYSKKSHSTAITIEPHRLKDYYMWLLCQHKMILTQPSLLEMDHPFDPCGSVSRHIKINQDLFQEMVQKHPYRSVVWTFAMIRGTIDVTPPRCSISWSSAQHTERVMHLLENDFGSPEHQLNDIQELTIHLIKKGSEKINQQKLNTSNDRQFFQSRLGAAWNNYHPDMPSITLLKLIVYHSCNQPEWKKFFRSASFSLEKYFYTQNIDYIDYNEFLKRMFTFLQEAHPGIKTPRNIKNARRVLQARLDRLNEIIRAHRSADHLFHEIPENLFANPPEYA